ncbi:Uncharacterized membrane protein YraQ, UPF0718 family [Geosporobacter subterraneus DSM 17957]|uniref:Uncharacterized membrane protein YraQ, UPF0718 family n=1 Tax=Geosporobacter subterraneus DSM 17957 TaxID=1121919 RepID=A0A1M6GEW2_9FIRM|nr:permease [Geosporobacter subterraneus]SHJ08504.1 Uncharacterized membrane protein YraQ, UPF0718 family [Geosporobacter subterraneus DSM 17957]
MMNLVKDVLLTVFNYLKADWHILLIGILMAVSINVYVDAMKLKKYLEKNAALSVPGSVAFGALTPLCACGTMAVLLSMFISSMPWGAVMAFLVSSPLTSPSEFMFQTSFFGARFATMVLISSIALGLLAGFIAHLLDMKTNFFAGQFRLNAQGQKSCCNKDEESDGMIDLLEPAACCSQEEVMTQHKQSFREKYKIDQFVKEFYNIGIKKILLAFIVFIAIGRIVEMIIPKEWILALFSQDKSYSIPLGATIGLPLYVSGSASLPIMKSFMHSGAGEGAVLAFLITGKATGIPVIAGMSTILRKKAILFYVGFVYLGGICFGYLYQALVNMLV